jgi:hypothetical protein
MTIFEQWMVGISVSALILAFLMTVAAVLIYRQRRPIVYAESAFGPTQLQLEKEILDLTVENIALRGELKKQHHREIAITFQLSEAKTVMASLTERVAYWEGKYRVAERKRRWNVRRWRLHTVRVHPVQETAPET